MADLERIFVVDAHLFKEKLANLLLPISSVVLMLGVTEYGAGVDARKLQAHHGVGARAGDFYFADFGGPLAAALLHQLRLAAWNRNFDGAIIQSGQTPCSQQAQSLRFGGKRRENQGSNDPFIGTESADLRILGWQRSQLIVGQSGRTQQSGTQLLIPEFSCFVELVRVIQR